MDLTDEQWATLAPLLPELPRRTDGRGRPWADSRKLLNGMLWVLRTGAQWQTALVFLSPSTLSLRRQRKSDLSAPYSSGALSMLFPSD